MDADILSDVTHITGVSSHVASAGGTVEAWFILTAIKLRLAVAACVVCGTFAVVRVSSVDTMSTVVAQLICLESCKRIWIINRAANKGLVSIKLFIRFFYTSLSSCNFTGHSGDVTIATRPTTHTITREGSVFLSTATSILTGVGGSTPVNWVLKKKIHIV